SFETSIALTFEVAVPGGAPARLPVAATGFQDLGPGAGPLHWATQWMWVSLPIAADATSHELGYAVVTGAPDGSCSGYDVPLAPMAVLIDRVVGPAAVPSEGP